MRIISSSIMECKPPSPSEFRLFRSISEDGVRSHSDNFENFRSGGDEKSPCVRELDFDNDAVLRCKKTKHSRSRSYHCRPRTYSLLSNVLLKSSLAKRMNKRRSLPFSDTSVLEEKLFLISKMNLFDGISLACL